MSSTDKLRKASETVRIVYHDDGETTELHGAGYAVRAAAHIAAENVPDALWALEVLNRYGHLVQHPADRIERPAAMIAGNGEGSGRTLPIRPDLAVYDRALAAVTNAHRLHDGPENNIEERQDSKMAAYNAVSDVTRAAGFREAAEAADTDEGVFMRHAWDGSFAALTVLLNEVRQQAAQRPAAELTREDANRDTPISATIDRATAMLAEARRIMDGNRHDPRTSGSTPAWYPFELDLSDLRGRATGHMEAATELSGIGGEIGEWSNDLRARGGSEDVSAALDHSAAVLSARSRDIAEDLILGNEGTEAPNDKMGQPGKGPDAKTATLSEIAAVVDGELARVRAKRAGTSEDSYATLNELHHDAAFLSRLRKGIQGAARTGNVDLSVTFEDDQDPEDEAEDRQEAMAHDQEYVPAAIRARDDHEHLVARVQPILDRLTKAGVEVRTGFVVVYPEERTEDLDDGPEV